MTSSIKKISWFAVSPVVTSAISFISLPILTYRLDAEDYGAFGLGIVFASLIAGVGSLGVMVYLGGQQLSDEQRGDGVKTAVFGAISGGLVVTVSVAIIWWAVRNWFPDLISVQVEMLTLIAIIGLCGAFNAVASDTMVHFGSARAYSVCTIAQALTFALTAYFVAFHWRADATALYAGAAAGAIAQSVLGMVSLRRHLHGRVSREAAIALWSVAKPTVAINYLDHLKTLMERWIISLTTNMHVLGLFFHSQQYRSIINLVTKVPVRGLWQTALSEAAEPRPKFRDMRAAWVGIDGLIFLAGIMFVLVGGELIGLLTHGKFSDAAPYAAVWMAITLAQNTGRPYVFVLIARGKAATFSNLSLKSNLVVFFGVPMALFVFGVWGVFVAIGAGALVTWILSRREALKVAEVEFADVRPAFLAAAVIASQLMISHFQPDLSARATLLFVALVGFLVGIVRNDAIRRFLSERITNRKPLKDRQVSKKGV